MIDAEPTCSGPSGCASDRWRSSSTTAGRADRAPREVRLDGGHRPPDSRGGYDEPRTDRTPGGSDRRSRETTNEADETAAGAWALARGARWPGRPRRRSAGGGEAGRPAEAHGGGRGLRPAVVERRLPAAAARLRALRRPLLLERRAAGSRSTPSSCGACGRSSRGRWAATSSSRSCRTSACGTTVLQDAWLDVNYSPKAAGPRREVQVPGRPRAAAVGHRAHVRRAGLPDGARPQPRRRA